LSDFQKGIKSGNWVGLIVSLILWCVVVVIFWKVKNKFQGQIKEKFENGESELSITTASVYSIAWFKEIYNNIPSDRKRIVQISFMLISAALIFLLIKLGNIATVATAGIIIVAAIGLLLWTVTAEREVRNRLHDELKVAKEMQMRLMPKDKPEFYDYDLYGICIPAKDVGGDIFDYSVINEKNLAVSLADVSGKGLDAALTTVFLSGAFSSEIKNSQSCSDVTNNLNKTLFSHTVRGKFVSFMLAIFDEQNKKISFVNAGQPKPILIRNNEICELNADGMRFPLGMMENVSYTNTIIDLKPGDIMVFYTDGISEAMNINNELYSSDKLIELLNKSNIQDLDSNTICMKILNSVKYFVGESEQHDDIALVVVKIKQI
jgi:serine phosphatase RsbU (regulator of sigma subunit)